MEGEEVGDKVEVGEEGKFNREKSKKSKLIPGITNQRRELFSHFENGGVQGARGHARV